MDLNEIVVGRVSTRNWIDSVQDRDYWRAFVYVALNLLVISHTVRYLDIVERLYPLSIFEVFNTRK